MIVEIEEIHHKIFQYKKDFFLSVPGWGEGQTSARCINILEPLTQIYH